MRVDTKTAIRFQKKILTEPMTAGAKLENGDVILTGDGFVAMILDDNDCLIDLEKVRKLPIDAIDDSDAKELKMTDNCKFLSPDKLMRLFEFENGDVMYLNQKFIKLFGKNITFKGVGNKAFVYRHDGMIGVIAAIRLREV